MKPKRALLLALAGALSVAPVSAANAPDNPSPVITGSRVRELINGPYIDIFNLPPGVFISDAYRAQLERMLRSEKQRDAGELGGRLKSAGLSIKRSQKELLRLRKIEAKSRARTRKGLTAFVEKGVTYDQATVDRLRNGLHCEVHRAKDLLNDAPFEKQRLAIRWQQRFIKLDLLYRWPKEKARLLDEIARGKHDEFIGLYRDIGYRKMHGNQYADWRHGRAELDEILGWLTFIDDPVLDRYVNEKINRVIAEHSDVDIMTPVKIVFSAEPNAYAMAGGHTFVTSELILAAKNKAQVMGIVGHEIGHVAALHDSRLQNYFASFLIWGDLAYDTTLTMLYVFDKIDFWTYWWMRFYGKIPLRFAQVLEWARKSRRFEAQADVLGAIYTYKAGYDPRGMIDFFDHFSANYGDHPGLYGILWMHPANITRMIAVYRVWLLLDTLIGRTDLKTNDDEFVAMQKRLDGIVKSANPLDRRRGMWWPPIWHKDPPAGCECELSKKEMQ